MEHSQIILDDGTGKDYDEALKASDYPDDGSPKFITKENATVENNPGVLVTFKINVDGEMKNVQTAITAKLFLSVAQIIDAKHPGLLD